MVADLVDQDMADDVAEAFVVLGPVIEDRDRKSTRLNSSHS